MNQACRWIAVWGLMGGCAGPAPAPPSGVGADTDEVLAHEAPTRRPLRRLTRSEYDRTVADLLGTAQRPAQGFPPDDVTSGFDVVAAGLSVSPLLVELYDQAAASLADEIVDRPLTAPVDDWLDVLDPDVTVDGADHGVVGDAVALYAPGRVRVPYDVVEPGTYTLSARVWTDLAGGGPTPLTVGAAGVSTRSFVVDATSAATAEWVQLDVPLSRGRAQLDLSFETDAADGLADRTLYVDTLRMEGPHVLVPRTNPVHDRVMGCDVEASADAHACAREVLTAFTPRAWRRPVDDAEIDALLGLFDQVLAGGDSPRLAMSYALRAVLSSPHFVMLVAPAPAEDGSSPAADDWTLASRLSYLLWSTMPDDALFARAAAGDLQDPGVLVTEVERLLRDERAFAFADDFAGQWLLTRALDHASPDPLEYPTFDEPLRESMAESMRSTFIDRLRADAPITDLLLSTKMRVNGYMAPWLGVEAKPTDGFLSRDVSGVGRVGWLSMPGLLMVTSYPTRTSPVRRGVWVLSNLLCDTPRPPPADVPSFPDASSDAATVRARLEAHRQDPACASCHDAIDPIGLALENFDGIGAWRETDAGVTIDASGQLPDGTPVDGAADLAHVLAADPRYATCVAEKLFTYAHGRSPDAWDRARLTVLTDGAAAGQDSFATLITRIVTDDAFRQAGVQR